MVLDSTSVAKSPTSLLQLKQTTSSPSHDSPCHLPALFYLNILAVMSRGISPSSPIVLISLLLSLYLNLNFFLNFPPHINTPLPSSSSLKIVVLVLRATDFWSIFFSYYHLIIPLPHFTISTSSSLSFFASTMLLLCGLSRLLVSYGSSPFFVSIKALSLILTVRP